MAASQDGLTDCEGDSVYASLHTGTTAWYILAARGHQPAVRDHSRLRAVAVGVKRAGALTVAAAASIVLVLVLVFLARQHPGPADGTACGWPGPARLDVGRLAHAATAGAARRPSRPLSGGVARAYQFLDLMMDRHTRRHHSAPGPELPGRAARPGTESTSSEYIR